MKDNGQTRLHTSYTERLHKAIPGGAHTYSRGDDQFPSNAPQILERGKGAYVFDPQGNRYLDYGLALRAVTLGYAFDEVDSAAINEIRKGNNLTRASLTELEAAELMTSLIPSAEMVKFAKNGSNAVTAAIKLARGYTGRKYVARCTEHPFFSFDDWFIGDTIMNKGIVEDIQRFTLQFQYNNPASLQELFDQYPGEIACIILEPATFMHPCSVDCKYQYKQEGCLNCSRLADNFLHIAKDICHKNGALFILDEMITGFRWHLQGAQAYFNISPDLCTFGKGMANGFSVAALTGKREIMNQGSITETGKERLFLVSTTHGAEMCGLGAFIKTVEVYQNKDVISHIWNYGRKLIDGMNEIAKEHGIDHLFKVAGYPCSPVYFTNNELGKPDPALRTLFLQEMIKNDVLMPWIALSYSHTDAELEITLNAVNRSLAIYKRAIEEGVDKFLAGQIVKPVFRKYN